MATEKDLAFMAAIIQSMEDPKINYQFVADKLGFKNVKSVANKWADFKKKMAAAAAEEGTTGTDAKPTPVTAGPNNSKNKVTKARAPAAGGGGKKGKAAPKGKGKGKKGDVKGEEQEKEWKAINGEEEGSGGEEPIASSPLVMKSEDENGDSALENDEEPQEE